MKCKFPTARMQGDTGPLDEDKCTVGATCPDLAKSSIPILPAMVSYIHQVLSVVTGGGLGPGQATAVELNGAMAVLRFKKAAQRCGPLDWLETKNEKEQTRAILNKIPQENWQGVTFRRELTTSHRDVIIPDLKSRYELTVICTKRKGLCLASRPPLQPFGCQMPGWRCRRARKPCHCIPPFDSRCRRPLQYWL